MLVHRQVTAFITTFPPSFYAFEESDIEFEKYTSHYLTNLNSKKSEQTHNHANKIKVLER